MIEFSMQDHAQRLIKLLEEEDTCKCCPYDKDPVFSCPISTLHAKYCPKCRSFVDLPEFYSIYHLGYRCPCQALGPEEAVKRTWIALEEGGWI